MNKNLDKWKAQLTAWIGEPGEYPFTRGIYKDMYKTRPWTMRQYAGFGSATETNTRFKYLLEAGQTGLSVAFDLPTQLGLDPDHPLALGEVGRVGVSIATLDDMRKLFDQIPLAKVTTSMTINAPAMMLLAMYAIVAEEQGANISAIGGTVQNDILKEYIARGTYIYPPQQSMRLITDMFEYCATHIPKWNTISISGYHIREAGSTAAQEIGFTLANAKAYVQAAITRGLNLDDFAPRLSFFFACHMNVLEEVAKFRAARTLWAEIMQQEFKTNNQKSLMLRFHTQTGGSTLTAQQPDVNTIRTTLEALAAVLGGTQSLHTNAHDEALGLPTPDSARLALRIQQVIAFESGITSEPDPLAGSLYLENLTEKLVEEAKEIITKVENLGGAVRAVEQGFVQREIEDAAYQYQRDIESGTRTVVGVNKFTSSEKTQVPIQKINSQTDELRSKEVQDYRAKRNQEETSQTLQKLHLAANTTENLFPLVLNAFKAGATLGEVCGVLRETWGEFQPGY